MMSILDLFILESPPPLPGELSVYASLDEKYPQEQALMRALNNKGTFKISLQKYNITRYQEIDFSSLTQMKDDYTTNSHCITCTLLFKKLGECTF